MEFLLQRMGLGGRLSVHGRMHHARRMCMEWIEPPCYVGITAMTRTSKVQIREDRMQAIHPLSFGPHRASKVEALAQSRVL